MSDITNGSWLQHLSPAKCRKCCQTTLWLMARFQHTLHFLALQIAHQGEIMTPIATNRGSTRNDESNFCEISPLLHPLLANKFSSSYASDFSLNWNNYRGWFSPREVSWDWYGKATSLRADILDFNASNITKRLRVIVSYDIRAITFSIYEKDSNTPEC